jgi:hypothetical protein
VSLAGSKLLLSGAAALASLRGEALGHVSDVTLADMPYSKVRGGNGRQHPSCEKVSSGGNWQASHLNRHQDVCWHITVASCILRTCSTTAHHFSCQQQ